MRLILLGAPGSGKGTLAKKISADFGIPQISTGDLFRAIVKENSPFAQKVKKIIDSGSLVPDEVTVEMVKNRIAQDDCRNGFILDGFPRTIGQAEALENIAKIDSVVLVELAPKIIIDRLSSRRTCSGCGDIVSAHDAPTGKCAKCNGKLIQRDDDKPEVIKHRLEVYNQNTAPLINFYSDRLFKVSNDKKVEETYKPLRTFLRSLEAENE